MPCLRQRQAWVAAAKVLWKMGQPIPRRALDEMKGVRCGTCGYEAEGVTFGWRQGTGRAFCPRCQGTDVQPGELR